MEAITISIITICYNNKAGLQLTIDSVRAQTFADKEFIVIDGGSKDGTQELINANMDVITLSVSEPDQGIYDAINKGIRHARGEWIVCMNAGDRFADEHVLSNIFQKKYAAETSVIYSDYWSEMPDGLRFMCHMNRSQGVLMHQSCIYRRLLHQRVGYYLVTKPYICSDLQFLLMIPESEYYKTNIPISINACNGVSQNALWCDECSLGLKVAFRIESMNQAFIHYHQAAIRNAIPFKIKRFIKKHILRQHYAR
jgi:glycosyltransferase involved in cell wall biosynthesis